MSINIKIYIYIYKISVAIWRRAARMVRACTPEAEDDKDVEDTEPISDDTMARRGHPGTAALPML